LRNKLPNGLLFEILKMFLTFGKALLLLLAGSLALQDQCCFRKTVGTVSYSLLSDQPTTSVPDQCLNDCVYTVTGTSSPKFCFAAGHLPTECNSDKPGECVCGVKGRNRIVGGEEASPGEWPWIVVFAAADGSSVGNCSGTLVADRWVVTAAHCVDGSNTDSLSVVIGEHRINSGSIVSDNDDFDDIRKNLELESIILHEGFDWSNYNHDIALLKLKEPVDLSVYTPACLPDRGASFTGETAWVYGWGRTETGGGNAETLRETTQTILSNEECLTREGDLHGFTYFMDGSLTDNMICGEAAGQDSCQGDSGGPFTVEVSGQHHLVGVVSWGWGCALDGLPGVYSSVSYHREWIDQQMESNGGAQFCALL